MKEELKQKLEKNEAWQRGLYMLFFIAAYGISKFIIIAVMLFQFFSIVLSGGTNKQLLKFGQSLSTYIYQIVIFLTFNNEKRPFPFSAWPIGPPDKIDQSLE
ncbi:MAG: DUF4389 domain-containing protein [Nitrosomonas sp.]|nr:DUF4389 domain-containing protein [Nitrosomonas sp.]MDP1950585.1 DUF4389 domain-containing protein [Nitrosomonas sp.]